MTRPPSKDAFLERVTQSQPEGATLDTALLGSVYDQAAAWATRAGTRFINSRLSLSITLCERLVGMRLGTDALAAALLYPLLEENVITRAELKERFGLAIYTLSDGIATLSRLNVQSKKAEQIKTLRKMFLGMANDIRTILIKLTERSLLLEAARDIDDAAHRQRLGEETLNLYAPIAGRLGMQRLKTSLENLAFAFAQPEDWARISRFVERFGTERRSYIDSVVSELEELLAEHGVKGKVYGRLKNPYSIYRKMNQKALSLDELYDVVAFRIIVQSVEHCYQLLGLVHARWRPIPQKFKDYVATAKPNGYQSLHTNVIGPFGDRMEIQIRTERMHEIAENGVASHWRYKESGQSKAARREDQESLQVQWLRMLLSIPERMGDDIQSFDSLKLDLFSDYVFAFTPQNEVLELPAGSSTVDFAFAVHTKVGMHMSGAKVNGRIVPIRHILQNGDVVEIITSKDQKPRREWLEFVKTGRARSKIRHAIREEEREASRKLGRELCEREFRQFGLNLNRMEKDDAFDKPLEKLRVRDLRELYLAIGTGQIRCLELARLAAQKHMEQWEAERAAAQPETPAPEQPKPAPRPGGGGIRISDIGDILVRYGKCCNPIPGDPIVGFITRGRGVTIHRAGCSKIPLEEQERLLDAVWDSKKALDLPVVLRVTARDRAGVLKDISGVFASHKISIDSVWADSKDGLGTSIFRMRIPDLSLLDAIKRDLMRVRGVLRVERVVDHH